MHTIIRDVNTPNQDFIFFADRLSRLVVEAGLGLLPFQEKTVITPTGHHYVGVDFARKLCGVSVIRSGESMEAALRTCCKGIKIGKILVVRHHGASSGAALAAAAAAAGVKSPVGNGPLGFRSREGGLDAQDVIYEKLPADIAERHVMLMDPVLSTGNSASRAVEVLLARGVPEDKIFFLCIIAAPEGISRLCSRYPQMKVITSEIDERVDEHFSVVPGCGEFGDRYFCD